MSNDMKIIKGLEKVLKFQFATDLKLIHDDVLSISGMTTRPSSSDDKNRHLNIDAGLALEGDSVVGLSFTNDWVGFPRIKEVPELVRGLTNLKILKLIDQDLKELPEWLKELVNLEHLDLRKNQLTFIPECIKELKNLKLLLFPNNQITNVPEWLKELKNLLYLDLAENQVTNLPEGLLECNALKVLELDRNNYNLEWNQKNIDILKGLPTKNMPSYFFLHILKGVPKEQVEIIIDLRNINNIEDRVWIALLKDFDEEFNAARDKEIIDIRVKEGKIAKIGIIGHKQNHFLLKTLPENFGELKYLSHLTLRNHRLESLPNSFGDLTNLEVLDLSENSIKSLPDAFVNFTSITKLNLSDNQFEEIPPQLWALTELTELDLSNNPLNDEENNLLQKAPDFIREYLRKKATIRVFISHAVIDFEPYRIGELVDYLEKQKEISQVFFCEEDLAGNIDEWMLDAVQKCQLVLFIGTNKSVFNSVDCANELQLADKFSIPVIPLKGKDVDWPDLAERNLSRELGLEYDIENFDAFCEDIYKYVENFKREINLMDGEERQKGIMNIYERFRLILNETVGDLKREIEAIKKQIQK